MTDCKPQVQGPRRSDQVAYVLNLPFDFNVMDMQIPNDRKNHYPDIEQRLRNVQEELRRSRESFLHLVQNNPFGIFIVDADMKLRLVSKGAEKVFAQFDPLIGHDFNAIMHTIWPTDIATEILEKFRHALETGSPYIAPTFIEYRNDTHQRESYEWQLQRLVLPDGRHGVVCYFYDATERELLVESTRSREQYFREMADAAPAMVWVTNANFQCTFLSRGWREFTGQEEEHGLGIGWLDMIHPEDREETASTIWPAVHAHESFAHDYRLRAASGEYRWALDSGRPKFDSEGNFQGYVGSVIDIHDRKTFEQSLERAKQSAEFANRSRGEFLANMSHEIRTPMAAILGHADILKDHLKNPDNVQLVEIIRRNGNYLLSIINDILDLSKIDAGKMSIEKKQVRPDAILSDIQSLMEVRAVEKDLPLKIEFAGPIPETIATDPVRLRQILLNLVGNAIKFTDRGEVKLVVRYVGSSPQDNQSENGATGNSYPTDTAGTLLFDVIDTGYGIAPDKLQLLFDPFMQVDNTSTRTFGGTGLGLAICRRLAHALGGEVKVESQPGKGSRFTLSLNVTDVGTLILPNLDVFPSADAPAEDIRLSANVLVVDDRRDIRYLAQHFIEKAGGNVVTATNGLEAVEYISSEKSVGVDLIVMDMQMPVMDGYQAVTELRRRGCQLPIIALTANAMKSDRDECLAAGCTDYTTKPLDQRKLVEVIARLTQA